MAGPTPERPRQVWQSPKHYFIDPESIASKVIKQVRTELRERGEDRAVDFCSDTPEADDWKAPTREHYFPTVPLSEHDVLTGSFKHLLVHRRPKGSDSPDLYASAIKQANDIISDEMHGYD